MKTNLLRKIMLACWLAVMASMGAMKAQTYDIIDDKFSNGPIGEVSVTITNKGSDQYPNYQTTYAIKWIRGFQINKLQAPSRDFGQLLYHDSQDEKYYYVTRIFSGADNIDGDYKAQSSYEPITDPQIVCNIFNYFTPNSTQLNDGIIEVSSSVTGAEYGYGSYPLKLDFRTQNSIQIQIKENVKVENFPFEINGANVTCRMEGDGSSSYFKKNELSSVTLNSGNFNLIGQVAGVSRFTMNGGVFTFDGQDGKCAAISTMDIKKGEIIVKNNKTNFSFNYLNINGDVTITGENLITEGNLSSSYIQFEGALAKNVTITSGNISFKEVGIHPTSTFLINNGTVVFEKATFTGFQFVGSGEDINSNIQLKSGSLLLDNCLLSKQVEDRDADYIVDVEGGDLTIKSGVYQGGKDAFFHVSGTSGQIILEGGHYRAGEYNSTDNKTDIIHQTDGKVEILDGTFQYAPICIEKGELAIKGGFFDNGDRVIGVKSEKEFNLWIKDNQADVKISGGDFSEASIYMSPNVNIQPTDLLDEGYLFYAKYNGYFEKPVTQTEEITIGTTTGHYLSFNQTKTNALPNSRSWEAAQKADVGPNGKDVRVVKTREALGKQLYTYEIKTSEGLIWLGANHNLKGGNELINGSEYTLDTNMYNQFIKQDSAALKLLNYPSVKIMADLDMSGYEWIPFQVSEYFLDGQGHIISNLQVNHHQEASFLSGLYDGILANIVIRNAIFQVTPNNPTRDIEIAGLVGFNNGKIVNCGVQKSRFLCDGISDLANVSIGGLVATNLDSISNSYITGNIESSIKTILSPLTFRSITKEKVYHNYGGLVGSFARTANKTAFISNCYFAGEFDCPESTKQNNIEVNSSDLVPNSTTIGTIENCYLDNEISLTVLNKNRDTYNSNKKENDIEWAKWIPGPAENDNYPVHGLISVIESKFTLQKEGNGEFKASYTYLKDETDPESEVTETIYADTTYTVVNSERFTITATPGEGAELVKVVQVKGDEEIELPNIKAGEPFEYNVVVTDTLKAYFKTTTLVVDQETTINGEDLTDIENIVIEANGQAETPTTVIFDGVKITDPKTGTTTIEKEANVILEISGQNSLGEIINHGTLIINPFYGFLDYRGVENNGQFTDYSSAIRSVTGTAALEITPLENKEVQEGESVTLTTTADAGGEVSFVWEKYENDTWIQVKPQVEEIATKATLRSTSKSDELKVSSLECGSYRCLISYENGTAKTTLTTYADVILKTEEPTEPDPEEPIEPDPEEPTDPIDPVDPTPSLYTVTIAEVCEGVTLESSTKTVEAGQDVTITLTVADGYDISGLELSYKLGTNGEWQDLTTLENGTFGQYIIKNVKDDVSVKATGAVYTAIEQVEGVKVYTANGILYVETPCRMPITIVSLTGVVIRNEESIGMKQYNNLNSGVYIVRVGDRVFKVRIG